MLRIKVLIYLLFGLSLLSMVNAATIYGAVYDLSLKKLNNARVEINTSPKQFLIAQNGSYSFNVPNGDYTIKSQMMLKNTVLASVQENITIKQDGAYVLDLILFPDVEEGVENIDVDVNGNIVELKKNQTYALMGLVILLILAIIFTGFHYLKKNKGQQKETVSQDKKSEKEWKYEGSDLEQIIKLIKLEGGRATQKDIRKQIPLSEAKISLMIAELEHKGVIEKIKKGRGNIIILKK